MATRIKQYNATYDGKIEVIDFRQFQAELAGVELTDAGLLQKDAKLIVEQWNVKSSDNGKHKTGIIVFSLPSETVAAPTKKPKK